MLIKKAPDIPSSDITSKAAYLKRREFLGAVGVTAAAAVTGVLSHDTPAQAAGGEPLTITSRMVTTTDKISPLKDISSYNNFFEFGSEKTDAMRNSGRFKPAPWSVAVEGLCNKPGTYTLEDILKPHALEERVYRMRCVEAWSMVIPWDGFPLGDLLARFEPKNEAKFVEFTTVWRPAEMPGQQVRFPMPLLPWPYREGLRMDEAMHPLTLIAVGMWGETLLNPEWSAAALSRALEVRVQEHQVHREDSVRRQTTALLLAGRLRLPLWVLGERQPECRPPGVVAEEGTSARRFPRAADLDVQRLRRPGRVDVRRDGLEAEFLSYASARLIAPPAVRWRNAVPMRAPITR